MVRDCYQRTPSWSAEEHHERRHVAVRKCAPWKPELVRGWEVPAGSFHDQRLANALDDLLETGLNLCTSAVFVRALEEYELDRATVRVDTTTASAHGGYASS